MVIWATPSVKCSFSSPVTSLKRNQTEPLSCSCSVLYTCNVAVSLTIISLVSMAISVREALRAAREQRGWSEEELAKKLGHEKSWVSRIETGKTDLRLSILDQILAPLGLTPTAFCRLVEIRERMEAELGVYQQTVLPFNEVRELSPGAREKERLVRASDSEADAAANKLWEAVRVLLSCLYQRQFFTSN